VTQDEIIRMAWEAGLFDSLGFDEQGLERFANLVAEATSDIKYEKGYKDGYAAALRIKK